MKNEIPLIDGDEQDCLTSWRKFLHIKRGQVKRVKRKYWKRLRKKVKEELRHESELDINNG